MHYRHKQYHSTRLRAATTDQHKASTRAHPGPLQVRTARGPAPRRQAPRRNDSSSLRGAGAPPLPRAKQPLDTSAGPRSARYAQGPTVRGDAHGPNDSTTVRHQHQTIMACSGRLVQHAQYSTPTVDHVMSGGRLVQHAQYSTPTVVYVTTAQQAPSPTPSHSRPGQPGAQRRAGRPQA